MEAKSFMNRQRLVDILTAPVQHLTRYPLMLRSIVHSTQNKEDKLQIQLMLDKADEANMTLNHLLSNNDILIQVFFLVGGTGRGRISRNWTIKLNLVDWNHEDDRELRCCWWRRVFKVNPTLLCTLPELDSTDEICIVSRSYPSSSVHAWRFEVKGGEGVSQGWSPLRPVHWYAFDLQVHI